MIAKQTVVSLKNHKAWKMNNCALSIEKHYRGHLTRARFHDYYSRKQNIRQLTKRNMTSFTDFKLKAHSLKQNWVSEKENSLKKRFNDCAPRFHHLMSTKAVPGVLMKKVAFGKPVEELIIESRLEASTRKV